MFQHKLQTDKGEDSPSFFKVEKTCKPDDSAKWKGPGGGASSFYTTWSFYAIYSCNLFCCYLWELYLLFLQKLASNRMVFYLYV